MVDNETKSKGKSRPRELNVQMEAFCVFITAIGSETFGNGKASAEQAGYAEASCHIRASRLLKLSKIRGRIAEIHQENMSASRLSVFTVLADLAHDRELARVKEDYSTCVRATELQGKYLMMFSDKSLVEMSSQRELEDSHRDFARILAARLLETGILDTDEPALEPVETETVLPGDSVLDEHLGAVGDGLRKAQAQSRLDMCNINRTRDKSKDKKPQTPAQVQAELDMAEDKRLHSKPGGETGMMREHCRQKNRSGGQHTCVNE